MWILNGEGKELVDARYFSVQKNVGGKDKKYAIVAFSRTTALVNMSGGVTCAYFPDEEKATAELSRVVAFFDENPDKIYKFSNR
ncbi:MAG: hypothetical protein NC203_09910 [Firmicutes bacterium]|nr:hypothetical protein [[Eubacterium] siraeum]MCM1488666.1 hypothetical protein [Bacillota bacterium]